MPGAKTSKKPSAPPRRRPENTSGTKRSESTASDRGWGAVVNKKIESERKKELNEKRKNEIWDFYLRDGETAAIQFLSDDPLCYDGHQLKDAYGNFVFVPCQLENQKHCLACRENSHIQWKAAFKVLDFRSKNKKGDMVFDEKPTEKLFKMGQQLAQQVQAFKKNKNLSDMVIEITRSGSGAKDTTYNLTYAEDEDGDRMEPISWKEKFGPIEEICTPPTDEEYEELGYVVPAEKETSGKGRR